jgi:DNA-binding LacI/PurR family transcriptional regulator
MGAATQAALERGYALVLVPTGHDVVEPFASVDLDGAVVVDPVANDPLVAQLRAAGVPVVTAGRIPGESDQEWWVDNDHVAGTLATLQHLERAGARRLALVTGPPLTSYTIDTLAAYHQWCETRGCEPQVATARGDLTESAGFAAAAELLMGPESPDAIYATLDRLALGVLLAAHAHGRDVPADLLVAGCSDSDAAKRSRPSLTALSLNPEEIGRQAVRMLIELTDGRVPAQSHVVVRTRVVPRASTKHREPTAAQPGAAGDVLGVPGV